MSVSDTLVLVEMGELIQGTIDKRTVGNGQNNNNNNNNNKHSSSRSNSKQCSEQRTGLASLRACL